MWQHRSGSTWSSRYNKRAGPLVVGLPDIRYPAYRISGTEQMFCPDNCYLAYVRLMSTFRLSNNPKRSIPITGWPRSYRKYLLQITQPSQYRYANLQYRFAVTSGSPSKYRMYHDPFLRHWCSPWLLNWSNNPWISSSSFLQAPAFFDLRI